tara:strand:+ start:374 stop:946 length:573 start_codon:yes stop_codon:yes gene_type:complete
MSRQKKGIRLNETDFYPTPSWCYENLEIDWSKFSTAHEPCAGDGRILDFLKSKDIDCSYSEITENKDFFDWNGKVDLILTNPPFSLSREFVDHSLENANTVIMLMRINFLGSKKRYSWWKQNPPTSLFVLSSRPSFTGKGTDATEYAWYVWDKTDKIPKGVYFVEPPTKEQSSRDKKMCREALEKASQGD